MSNELLSKALREAFASYQNKVVLDTLEFFHPYLPLGSRLFVASKKPLKAKMEAGFLVDFLAANFTISFPTASDGVQEMQIEFDNTAGQLQEVLNSINKVLDFETWKTEQAKVRYRVYLEGIEEPQLKNPIELWIKGYSIQGTTVSLNAAFLDIVNRSFLTQNYTRKRFPGLGDYKK